MKQLYKIMALFLLLAVAGGQCGFAQNDTIPVIDTTVCENFTWNNVIYTSSTDFTDTLENASGGDSIVVIHLTINQTTYGDTVASACESFTWYDSTFYESGFYTHTYNSSTNCDSIVTLHLTIHHGTHTSQTAFACGNYVWHDTVRNTTGIYTCSYTNNDGCPSVDTLHLKINNPTHNSVSDTACETYTWTDATGETYTSSGTYLHPHEDVNGCTQVDTLHLTINHTTYGDTTVVACEIFTWHGIPYTETPAIAPTYTIVDGNHNGCDSIVTLHLTIHHGTHNVFIVDTCESYTWHGQTYTASGNYTYPYNNEYGCPSVDTLYLTINNPIHTAITRSACGGYEWHDSTYTESGDYFFSHSDVNGCTQVDTLHLTINNPVHLATTVTTCESYTWNGTLYTVSDEYTYAHLDAHGCWQVDTLHLTINSAYHTDLHVSACETYTWNGQTYTESGNYDQTFTAANGCDSLVTLHLTINNPIHTAITRNACGSYDWHDSTYTESGDYFFSHSDVNGCTQVDTLHLTINNPVHADTTVVACGSYTWNGTLYTVSGDYTYAHLDAHGCWQVDTLHLTINHATYGDTIVVVCESFTWHGTTYTETPAIAPTYTIVGGNHNGCDSIVTLTLTVHPLPTPFITGDNEICSYDTTTLVAGGGIVYTWSTGESNNQIQVSETGTYYVTVTDVNGCSNTTHIVVSLAPTDTSLSDAIVTKSHDGVPYMLIYPKANLLYQWYENGVAVPDETRQYYAPNGGLQKHTCYKVLARPLDDKCGVLTKCWELTDTSTTKVRILPNPNNGQFRLLLPEGTVQVQILDANGQTVLARKTDGATELDMNTGLANGLYFVKIFRQDGSFNTEKLIINR